MSNTSRRTAPTAVLLLQLQGASTQLVNSISSSLQAIEGCLIIGNHHTSNGTCLELSVLVPKQSLAGATAPAVPGSADAVLQAVAWLEQNAQPTAELQVLLRQEGFLQDTQETVGAETVAEASSNFTVRQLDSHNSSCSPTNHRPEGSEPGGSTAAGSPQAVLQNRSAQPIALSPAGPAPLEASAAGPAAGLTGSNSCTATRVKPADKEGSSSLGAQQVLLVTLLQRCGILVDLYPQHDAAAVQQLQHKVWRTLLAPVTEIRSYFGDQVGFYLAYLNALTCWLVAPAAVSGYLLWALNNTGDNQTGLSSPLVPVLVVFQLLWSAAGVKLWRRHQALLRQQWHSDSSHTLYAQGQTLAGLSAPASTKTRAAAPSGPTEGPTDRQPSLAVDHLGGGVPQWAVRAPNATGTRWQFTGTWWRNPRGHWQLVEPLVWQLIRLAASLAATGVLLALATTVLLVCLNFQGLIAPGHSLLYLPSLAAVTQPGGLLAEGVLKQVPMLVRVLAVATFDACIFGPAARALSSTENRRTLEGFDASLTAKKTALQFIFTFAPPVYVGLAGAGAAAAANDAAGYFRLELLRRLLMELIMPAVSLWSTARSAASKQAKQRAESPEDAQRGPKASTARLAPTRNTQGGQSQQSALPQLDVLKPPFDTFTGTWDVTRDMGYVMLFASTLPWAAPLTLLYTLANIKQDCLALLFVHQRPKPRRMRTLGSWNVVLVIQVFLAVITNVFLSGLSSGQLAQLLPSQLVGPGVASSLTAAATARPADSTAAYQMGCNADGCTLSPFGALHTLSSSSSSSNALRPSLAGNGWNGFLVPRMCPLPNWHDAALFSTQGMCPAGHQQKQHAVLHSPLDGTSQDAAAAATSHLLLLFIIEHLLLLVLVLIMNLVPDGPAAHTARQPPQAMPPHISNLSGSLAEYKDYRPDARQQGGPVLVAGTQQSTSAGPDGTGSAVSSSPVTVHLHGNPLFTASTARESSAA